MLRNSSTAGAPGHGDAQYENAVQMLGMGAGTVACERDMPRLRLRCNTPVARRDGVDDLNVQSPYLVPFHEVRALAEPLPVHEISQSGNGKSTSHDAADGGKAWIVPAVYQTLIHKPLKLAF